MRGEEPARHDRVVQVQELPPHARRREPHPGHDYPVRGITSACAEKSGNGFQARLLHRNYLRMRGEERKRISGAATPSELPPHARRRDIRGALEAICTGITSACAEKRIVSSLDSIAGRNYLRMRGEESLKSRRFVDTWELPPHARRRVQSRGGVPARRGITSACAEKSVSAIQDLTTSGNYLRMRGEELPVGLAPTT